MKNFREAVLEGIPKTLPKQKNRSINISHAPNRKHILNIEEKKLAIRNALRYFPKNICGGQKDTYIKFKFFYFLIFEK